MSKANDSPIKTEDNLKVEGFIVLNEDEDIVIVNRGQDRFLLTVARLPEQLKGQEPIVLDDYERGILDRALDRLDTFIKEEQ